MQTFRVVFDSGPEVDVELKSRDIAKAERLGFQMDESKPVVGSYALAFIALQRIAKSDSALAGVLPASAEGLEDVADIVLVEDDAAGEDGGQGPASG